MSSEKMQARRAEASIPDPYLDGPGYLLARGWRPEGDPRQHGCRWLDPQKPGRYPDRSKVRATKDVVAGREEVVAIGHRTDEAGHEIEVTQLFCYPIAWPVSLDEARFEQLERDRKAGE